LQIPRGNELIDGVVNNKRPVFAGLWQARLNGLGKTNTMSIGQVVQLPVLPPPLTFWLRVDSAETGTFLRFDKLNVEVQDETGKVLGTLGTYSNLDKGTTWIQKWLPLTAFAGKKVQIVFKGKEDNSYQTTFLLDDFMINTLPTPTVLTATLVTRGKIDLAWQPSTDNIGVIGYNIYRNGVFLVKITTPNYQDNEVAVGTTYRYEISAVDKAGNESPRVSISATP